MPAEFFGLSSDNHGDKPMSGSRKVADNLMTHRSQTPPDTKELSVDAPLPACHVADVCVASCCAHLWIDKILIGNAPRPQIYSVPNPPARYDPNIFVVAPDASV